MLAFALFAQGAFAQLESEPPSTAQGDPQSDPQVLQSDAAPPRTLDADPKKWSFSAAVNFYIVPDDQEYIQPTLTADRGWLHLEARYNYESRDTASLWIGYNFIGGKSLEWEFTPMIGGVFGEVNGIAPGFKLTLTFWKLQFYTEDEYVFDKDDSSNNFFYSWSELSLAPVEWLRFGIVAERTRLYESDREVQVGPLIGLTFDHFNITAYALNPDEGEPTFIISVGVNF